jgi:hypothetical protein
MWLVPEVRNLFVYILEEKKASDMNSRDSHHCYGHHSQHRKFQNKFVHICINEVTNEIRFVVFWCLTTKLPVITTQKTWKPNEITDSPTD